jgi:hypothetical protein
MYTDRCQAGQVRAGACGCVQVHAGVCGCVHLATSVRQTQYVALAKEAMWAHDGNRGHEWQPA